MEYGYLSAIFHKSWLFITKEVKIDKVLYTELVAYHIVEI